MIRKFLDSVVSHETRGDNKCNRYQRLLEGQTVLLSGAVDRGSRCRVSLQFGVSDQGFRAVHGNIHKITDSYFIHLDLCRGSWYRKKRMTLLQTSLPQSRVHEEVFIQPCTSTHRNTFTPQLESTRPCRPFASQATPQVQPAQHRYDGVAASSRAPRAWRWTQR